MNVHLLFLTCFGLANALNEECSHNILADIVFVIDMSLSTSSQQFELEKNFVGEFVKGIAPLGKKDTQVAVISFSSKNNVYLNLKLNQSYNADVFHGLVKSIPKKGYMTYTGEAFKLARDHAFDEINGARKGAKRFIVLLTDGRASDGTTALQEAEKFRKNGDIVIGVGIREAGKNAVTKYAYNQDYVFEVKDYDGLKKGLIKSQIIKRICDDTSPPTTVPSPPTTTPKPVLSTSTLKPSTTAPTKAPSKQETCIAQKGTDLVFLIDSSSKLTATNEFKNELAQVRAVLMELSQKNIPFGANGDSVQVGVVLYAGKTAKEVIKFSDHSTFEKILKSAGTIKSISDSDCHDLNSLNDLSAALKVVSQSFASGRKSARKIVFALSDGLSNDVVKMKDEIDSFKKENIASMAFSPNTDPGNELKILGNAGYYTKDKMYDGLRQLEGLVKKPCFDGQVFLK